MTNTTDGTARGFQYDEGNPDLFSDFGHDNSWPHKKNPLQIRERDGDIMFRCFEPSLLVKKNESHNKREGANTGKFIHSSRSGAQC